MTHSIIEAVVLGIIQGIAEFLPISSSGHLVIFGDLLQKGLHLQVDESHNLILNVALHVGTLGSILTVYRREVVGLIQQPRLCGAIVIATIPAAIVGLLFEDQFKAAFSTPLVAGIGLLITALLLIVAQKLQTERRSLDQTGPAPALAVGAFQSLALVPGISRSGSTIAAGLFAGLKRDAATTFSFLIAIPAIGGAAVLTAAEAWQAGLGSLQPVPVALGMLTAFLVGLAALRLLIRAVSRGKLHWFAYYCLTIGVVTIVWQVLRASGNSF
ncbi:MAG: undecaprenyl-diphosphate phosphatase [Planctomycetes bacterium]|nr:undecaprenyl-diphosphate phosphatase [Planctomycetota bacterium]